MARKGYSPRMLSLCAVILALLVFFSSSYGVTTFERTYGGPLWEEARSVQQTSDGGYVIGGYTWSYGAGEDDFYILRTDSTGDTVWTRVYGSDGRDLCYSILETPDGDFVASGRIDPYDFGLIKMNPSGDTLWARRYNVRGRESRGSVDQTSDGGYIIVGTTAAPIGPSNVCLVRTDSLGEATWARWYGGSVADFGHDVSQTPDGGYIVAGETWSFSPSLYDVYLVKTNDSGDIVWTKTYGGPQGDTPYSVVETSDGGYILGGYTSSFGAGKRDVYVIKTDSLGDLLWSRTYGGAEDDAGISLERTSDGGYIIAGVTWSFGVGLGDVFLVRIDSLGDIVWTRTHGGAGYDVATSVWQTSDGGYIVAGYTYSFGAGESDVYLIKTDRYGRVQVCDPVEPWQVRTQGYWRRQCRGNPHEDICTYMDSIHILADLFDGFGCDSICDLLGVDPPENDMCRKARRQFMALLLNIASGRLAVCNCLEDGREVGDIIAEMDSLLSESPDFASCERAKTLADDLNNGIGIVLCDTLQDRTLPSSLLQSSFSAAPNPFVNSTVIRYEVLAFRPVKLEIYDKVGRLVRTLIDSRQQSGSYQMKWDGFDESGRKVPTGVYFSRIQTGNTITSGKLILLR